MVCIIPAMPPRKKASAEKPNLENVHVLIPRPLLEQVDQYVNVLGAPATRSDALRDLIRAGLAHRKDC